MHEVDKGVTEKMHTVNYELTWTRNMGNFESLKVTVGLSQEGVGHPDKTLAKVREWVETNLGVAVEEVTESVKG